MAGTTRQNRRRPRGLSTLAGLVPALWLKSDSFIYSDTGSTASVDSTGVQTWRDYSGNARNVSQATSGYRPKFYEGALNSAAAVSLDGIDDRLTGTFTTTVEGRWFVVYRQNYLTRNYRGLICAAATGAQDYPDTSGLSWHDSALNQYRYTPSYRDVAMPYLFNTNTVHELLIELSRIGLARDGGIFTYDNDSTPSFTNADKISIGSRLIPSEQSFTKFDIYELIFFNTAITDTQRADVLQYLATKYLAEPINVIATQADTSVVLTWQAASFANSYDVSYKAASDSGWTFWANTSSLTSTITGLTPGTAYNFKVQSVWSF